MFYWLKDYKGGQNHNHVLWSIYIKKSKSYKNWSVTKAKGWKSFGKSFVYAVKDLLKMISIRIGGKPVPHQLQEGLDYYTQHGFQEVSEFLQ